MSFNRSKFFAWSFLYAIVFGCLIAYVLSNWHWHLQAESGAKKIVLIPNFFLLLLPMLLPAIHLIFSLPRSLPLSKQSRLVTSLILFLIALIIGYKVDETIMGKLMVADYFECKQQRRAGVRAMQVYFVKGGGAC